MSVDAFFDSNILIYAATGAGAEAPKRIKALALMGQGRIGISAQVLQEFYVNVTLKAKVPLTPAQALVWINLFDSAPCVAIDRDLVKAAIAHAARYQISYWDGAIVAAAEALGAPLMYSEDLNDGQIYGSVRVENPFRAF